jgi:hypothetical protein
VIPPRILPLALLPLALLLLAGGFSRALAGGSLSSVGQLPGEKVPEVLLPKERNPFTRRDEKPTEVAAEKETEETKLRAILRSMPLTGVVRGGPSDKVLLGSLILEPGAAVPSLLKGQTERLVVAAVTEKQVEIQFIETEATAEPRRIFIPIDLHPHVTAHLPTLPKIIDPPTDADIRVPE